MSSKESVKRITVKLKHPNPLFEKWLEEWRDEAAARSSDTQYAFAKALQSLKKYPLPLKTGKECLILENFGTRICLLLDRKLADHKKTNPDDQITGDVKEVIEETQSPKAKRARKIQKRPNTPTKKRGKSYVPTVRSAPYAVLVALHEHLLKTGPPGEMLKSDLQKAAQPLCDTSMFKPLPGSYYSGWSCVGQLISKQLVLRRGNPHRYSLTEDGIKLAEKLSDTDLDSAEICVLSPNKNVVRNVPAFSPNKNVVRNIPAFSPKKSTSNVAQEISQGKQNTELEIVLCEGDKETNNIEKSKAAERLTKKNNSKQNKKEPFNENQGSLSPSCDPDVVFLSQKTTSSQSSQAEEVIFVPGSFETILLVDTQEIHKGDELVKALEALGVRLEVRRLKVGDFAWVSRNTAGAELLLPYIVERKRLDDLASSIKDGRFHEQNFRMKQSGVPHCMYLVESHGQRHYSLPTSTLLQAAANTEFVDRFSVKHTANSHETVVYLASFTKVITRKFANKTLLGCMRSSLPEFNIRDDCVSLMTFKEFNKLASKTRKYNVKEMFIKQLVQLRGLSVEKALAIVERYPSPRSLIAAFASGNDKLLADIPSGTLNRKIGPVISKAVYQLYSQSVLT